MWLQSNAPVAFCTCTLVILVLHLSLWCLKSDVGSRIFFVDHLWQGQKVLHCFWKDADVLRQVLQKNNALMSSQASKRGVWEMAGWGCGGHLISSWEFCEYCVTWLIFISFDNWDLKWAHAGKDAWEEQAFPSWDPDMFTFLHSIPSNKVKWRFCHFTFFSSFRYVWSFYCMQSKWEN